MVWKMDELVLSKEGLQWENGYPSTSAEFLEKTIMQTTQNTVLSLETKQKLARQILDPKEFVLCSIRERGLAS